jgi:protein-S-isoprenylcysteine O-methyltransferase Ste14
MKERKGEHPYGDAGQLILLGAFLLIWIADSFFIHASTPRFEFLALSARLTVVGVILIAVFYLQRSGHAAVRQRGRAVLTTGAFQYVRHPLYLAILLFYLALVLITVSFLSLGLLLAIFAFYDYIAGYEERIMEEKFGDTYRKYKRRTGKWVPRIGRRS